MEVVCENCGKKYNLNPKGLEGKRLVFKCRSCEGPIRVRVEGPPITGTPSPAAAAPSTPAAAASSLPGRPDPEPAREDSTPDAGSRKGGPSAQTGTRGETGRGGLFTLFMALPILIIIVSGLFYMIQVGQRGYLHKSEGLDAARKMAAFLVTERARAAAGRCQVHLITHPELNTTNFHTDPVLRRLVLEKVGRKGFTFMYSVSKEGVPPKIWLSPSLDKYGSDLDEILAPFPPDQVDHVKRILQDVYNGVNKEHGGGAVISGENKTRRELYLALSPVEGTRFGVFAFAYLDEIAPPLAGAGMEAPLSAGMKSALVGIVAGAILLLVAIARLGVTLQRLGARLPARAPNHGERDGSTGEFDKSMKGSVKPPR